jgi:hypothetical protein
MWSLPFIICVAQMTLDSLSKGAQVSLAVLAYLSVGGSLSGIYINYRLTKFEKDLFTKLDAKFVNKEICRYRHNDRDVMNYHPSRLSDSMGSE